MMRAVGWMWWLLLGCAVSVFVGCSDGEAEAACVAPCDAAAGEGGGGRGGGATTAAGTGSPRDGGGSGSGGSEGSGDASRSGTGGAGGAASDAGTADAAIDGGATTPGVTEGWPDGCGDGTCASFESCADCAIDCAPCGTTACGGSAANCVTLDDTTLHQTMRGWEATSQSGEGSPAFDAYKDQLFDRAANELGINRVRVEVKSPSVGADFALGAVDDQIEQVVMPLRAELAARGESLWVNVCVVGSQLKDDPTRYAEQALRTVQHIESTYGFVPNSWEVALEPDVFGWNDAMLVGNALVAAGKLLAQNGYDLDFVAPSTTQAARAPMYAEVMESIPDIFDHWRELSYHRYDYPDAAELQAIAAKAAEHGLRTSMLEHIDSGHADLFADLTEANVSVWQQYTLAYPAGSDDGAQYYWPDNGGATLTLANRARYLRQYFAYVRNHSIRIGTSSTRDTLEPTAFITPESRYVVVMQTSGSLTMDVAGLPAGTYGITYTTASDTHAAMPEVTVGTGEAFTVSIPGSGVITVFGK